MSYQSQAAQYRETQVITASPGRLVLMVYDHLLVSLHQARSAVSCGDVARRGEALHRARTAVGELLGTLDMDRGGTVASTLAAIYAHMLSELIAASRDADHARIDRVTRQAEELRSAFADITGEQDESP